MKAQQLVDHYAQAIYQAAFEPWLAGMQQAAAGLRNKGDLFLALTDVAVSEEQKRARLREILPADATREMGNALLLMASEDDLGLLDEVVREFERLVTAGTRRRVAEVTTAVPLTDAEQTALRGKLSDEFGSGLEFEFHVDPAILGGVIAHVGGQVIDDSVAGKLARLRESLGLIER